MDVLTPFLLLGGLAGMNLGLLAWCATVLRAQRAQLDAQGIKLAELRIYAESLEDNHDRTQERIDGRLDQVVLDIADLKLTYGEPT